MRIIITAIGSSGDINPMVTIASKLQSMGHEVVFIASPVFHEKVSRHGIIFEPLGTEEDYYTAVSDPDAWKVENAFGAVWKYVMKAAELNFDAIKKHIRDKQTLLIGTTLAIGARFIQERMGLPLATVHLSPSLMLSAYDTPKSDTNPIPEWAPTFVRSLFFSFCEKTFLDPICMPPLNAVRARLSLPPVNNVMTRWIHSPELVLCAFPEWFAAVQPDWPPNCYNTNFPLFKTEFDPPLLPEIEQFLDAGEAPIAITAGTAMAFARPFLERGLEMSKLLNRRCLLVCNFKEQLPPDLPDWALPVSYANFQALFKRVSMAVHHGGIGTSAMAIYCGTPQMISPFAHDQSDNAMRLQKIGLARAVSLKDGAKTWAKAGEGLMSEKVKQDCLSFQRKLESQPSGTDTMIELIQKKLIKPQMSR